MYRDSKNKLLYVGKAVDLAKRVKQYFLRDNAVGEKTRLLVSQISSLDTIETMSEFDALLLEARLIRQWEPKYNVVARDDKSPLYIVITLEERLPRIFPVRKTSLQGDALQNTPKHAVFGPFQNGQVTRDLLRTVRSIIPFCTQKRRDGRQCFYTHLGLCNPCPSAMVGIKDDILRKPLELKYRRNIFRIKDLLSGNSYKVIHEMETDMRLLAKEEKFEEANRIKQKIEAIYNLQARRFDPAMYLERSTLASDIRKEELSALRAVLQPYFHSIKPLHRIECIDISHTGGSSSTGSLVVLANGITDTGQYRRFKIRRKEAPNDTAMIAEVISRRIGHAEWPMPDLLVIDGGKGQISAAMQIIHEKIPIIGLAKRFEEIIVPIYEQKARPFEAKVAFKVIRLPLTSQAIHVLQRIRDEAHRFARSYHHLLRSKLIG